MNPIIVAVLVYLLRYMYQPTLYMYQVATGTMTDRGSMKTGMYLAISRLYTGIADSERWPVDRLRVASQLVDLSPAHPGGGGVRCGG